MDGKLHRSDSGGRYLCLLAHETHTAEHTPGITKLHMLRPFQCYDDQYDTGCATNVLLDVCVTFVISKHPLRRCTLPLNQFNAFKLLLVALCYLKGTILDGLERGFAFSCVKGTKWRFLPTAHHAVICKSHACVDLNLHADSHSHRDLLPWRTFFSNQLQ